MYQQHLSALRRQGKADRTIEAYARAVRRITEFFDIFPAGQNAAMRQSTSIVMDRGGVQKAVKAILKIRHCYGAHLVEAGVNLRAIQHEMGHESPKTTSMA